ncbi:Undecaprenyl-diphosphatase [uncultured archaeon]|nr:Undecaprenyl-diphosphatase [uncultured archaeon]
MLGEMLGLVLAQFGAAQQVLYGIILGIVQGVAEWLPISSKTQVLVVSTYLLNLNFQQAYTFGLFMEIGSVIAAVIYFRKELVSLVQVLLGSPDAKKRKLFVYVLTATVVTGVIGTPLYLFADSITGLAVGIPMLIIGAVLILDSVLIWHSRRRRDAGRMGARKLDDLKMKDFVIVGAMQGIAALPGVSRSGITTSTLLLMDVEPDEAFRLSFLVGIFAAVAAFSLTLIVSHSNVSASLAAIGLTGVVAAIVTSSIVSICLIDFLIKVAGKSKIVYVTAALGIIAIAGGVIYLALGLGVA